MPHLASADDGITLRVIEKWRTGAAETVEEIADWRKATFEFFHHKANGRIVPPKDFASHTSWLVGWLTSHHPALKPDPLLSVNAWILRWYDDESARHIPANAILRSTLERATILLDAVVTDILGRATKPGDQGLGFKRQSPGAPAAKRRPKATIAARMIDLVRDTATRDWTSRQFADKLGCSPSAVVVTMAWKQLCVSRDAARLGWAGRAVRD